MPTAEERLAILDEVLTEAAGKGLLQLTPQDDAPLDGRTLMLDGEAKLNFGSCSYVGLETDLRLKQGAIAAVSSYGVQFASSRAYLSAPPYRELERLLGQLFGAPLVVAQTTTLAQTTRPVLLSSWTWSISLYNTPNSNTAGSASFLPRTKRSAGASIRSIW